MAITKPNPARAEFDTQKLADAARLLNKGIDLELYPGAALLISRRKITAMLWCVGHTDFTREIKVDKKTLFDLASLTKPIATASSILLLCEDGNINLEQSVTEFFPGRRLPHLEKVTLRLLLNHTSGLPAWRDLYSKGQTRRQVIEDLFAVQLEHEPGTFYAYSCLGYILLGLVVEAASGEGLDLFTRRRLFEPIGMPDTAFNPISTTDTSSRVFAATDHSPLRRRKLFGEVHDENAYAMDGVSGNAGLFSNIQDLATFCHSITFPNQTGKNSPLSPASLKLMFQNSLSENLGKQSLGWFMTENELLPTGDFVSKSVIGHSGFTGTAILIDPAYELFMILLTNRVCREDDGSEFRMLRRDVFNAIVGAIV